jgi:hypothetical protein
MKKRFLIILLSGLTTAAFAQAPSGQGELTTTTGAGTKTNATGQIQTELAKPRPPQAAPLVPTEGVIQTAVRTGQPIQLINPAAPARFGSGQQHASHDPKNPGKPKGIVLFSITF